ncbi:MAG: 8-amino-7-oxononanoate synthase [Candidatus Schekmanbacteria bacterium]|nr:MAG: 8-amino-7-oxononanoate synthase [Candidatus Schekmanbacteria bacterium]
MDKELEKLKKENLYRSLRIIESAQKPKVRIEGKEFLLFSSNNYLGLSNNPIIKKKAAEALKKYGCGACASRLISGNVEPYVSLEKTIARFKGTKEALVFSSGYAANVGTISTIAESSDTIFSDALNHASIIDGCRLSRAQIKIYNHKDVNHLEDLVKKTKGRGKKIIITDSIFSMDGDIAPLGDIQKVAKKYGCLLFVDDAHATGTLGKRGRGSAEFFNINGKIDIYMGTLSKAVGSVGGFIAGKRKLIEFLINRSRSFIYSTGLPPSALAASQSALELIEKDLSYLNNLKRNEKLIKEGLEEIGYDTMESETQIIPVLMETEERAIKAFHFLFKNNIFVPAIRPPTVPKGKARLRITPMASHTRKDIEYLLDVFAKMKKAIFK